MAGSPAREQTRQVVRFIPVAVNRGVRGILVGRAVEFDASAPFTAEKARLKKELELRVEQLYRTLEDGERLVVGRD